MLTHRPQQRQFDGRQAEEQDHQTGSYAGMLRQKNPKAPDTSASVYTYRRVSGSSLHCQITVRGNCLVRFHSLIQYQLTNSFRWSPPPTRPGRFKRGPTHTTVGCTSGPQTIRCVPAFSSGV